MYEASCIQGTNLFQCLGIVIGQLDFLPHMCWRMRSFDRLDEEVECACYSSMGKYYKIAYAQMVRMGTHLPVPSQ